MPKNMRQKILKYAQKYAQKGKICTKICRKAHQKGHFWPQKGQLAPAARATLEWRSYLINFVPTVPGTRKALGARARAGWRRLAPCIHIDVTR